MNKQARTIRCIALCTGYGDCASICWALLTHDSGFGSTAEALRTLASEILEQYLKRWPVVQLEPPPPDGAPLDPARFVAFVNHLLRGSWGDWEIPDVTHWWPYTSFDALLDMRRNSVLVIPSLGAEVLLAAHDDSLLTQDDVESICRELPEIAEALGLRHFDCAAMAAAGSA